VTIRKPRWIRVVVAAVATHVAANLLLGIVLLLPGAEPRRDALALPILLVAGTAIAARWSAADPARSEPATVNLAALHGILVGGLVGVMALAYGPVTGLLTTILTIAIGWLANSTEQVHPYRRPPPDETAGGSANSTEQVHQCRRPPPDETAGGSVTAPEARNRR
jgi:hypothetical protein